MAYTKQVWVDRDVQYPNRYKDQNNNTLTLTRDEGTVNEAGTLFNAAKMNNIEDGIFDQDARLTTAEAVIGNETDTYSASSTYALGSLVIYNNLLYKCTTAITVAEAWNGTKWTQTSLASLIQSNSAYSTTEQIIGKWIDGKPLYRKVINFTSNNLAGDKFQYDIFSLHVEEIINMYGKIGYNSTLLDSPIPINSYYDSTHYTSFYPYNGNLYGSVSSGFTNKPVRMTIEYTKTTD